MCNCDFTYWARSTKQSTPNSDSRDGWQRLAVHLEAVGALAERLAESARPGDERFAALARLSGLLHDYGKYSNGLPRILAAGGGRYLHGVHSAPVSPFGASANGHEPSLAHVAAVIAGHVATLMGLTGERHSLKCRFKEGRLRQGVTTRIESASQDSSNLRDASGIVLWHLRMTRQHPGFARLGLRTRVLCDCLLDSRDLRERGCLPQHHSPALGSLPRIQSKGFHAADQRQ
jgi:hypothetical protein